MTDNLRGEKVYRLLSLVMAFGAGGNRIWDAVKRTGSLNEAYDALFTEKSRRLFTAEELRNAERVHDSQIQGIISYCESHNIGILCYDDRDYPRRLRNIFSPPVLLFYKGNRDILNEDIIIAVVGSRHISSYTERAVKAITERIASGGIVVASGFAVGTDIAAHLAAVRCGGKTIAVLGSGIDYNYPEANSRYRDEILENGVFISEYFPQTAAKPMNFIARNRILSGISAGAAVMEASDRSGSLNTASYAISQGKDIWVLPPSDIFDPRYNGNKKLLYDGAVPIYSPDDILKEYFENYGHKPVFERPSDYAVLGGPEKEKKASSARESFGESPPQEEKPFSPEPELLGLDKLVYDALKEAGMPLAADDIAEAVGTDISDVLTVITELEIEGIVSSESGQTYFPAARE